MIGALMADDAAVLSRPRLVPEREVTQAGQQFAVVGALRADRPGRPPHATGVAATDKESGDVRHLVGRAQECARVDRMLADIETAGAALVIRGEAGVGKTALLEYAAARAPCGVTWVRGVESEAVLPFAAAADLLLPRRKFFDQVPPVQRSALEGCLAVADHPSPSLLAACAGALGVLSAAAEGRPLAVLVDDYQWIDPASKQLILFVARRVECERLIVLISVREVPGSEEATPSVPSILLRGLTPTECWQIAAERQIHVAPHVVDYVVRETGGNPLAVIETLASAHSEPRLGGRHVVDRPALTPSLVRVWSRVLAALPAPTRHALFVVANCPSGRIADVENALAAMKLSLADLEPAESAGLINATADCVHLRHALLRPIVLGETPLAVRLDACRALAGTVDDDLKAWLLAAGATGPDEEVAAALAEAAESARRRSGYGASARAWQRAADLTPDPAVRAARLLNAARDAQLSGQHDVALEWCSRALRLRSDARFVADAGRIRGQAQMWLGLPARAVDDFRRAADGVVAVDPVRAAAALADAWFPAVLTNQLGVGAEMAREAESLAAAAGARSLMTSVVAAQALILRGEMDEGAQRLQEVADLLSDADLVKDQQAMVIVCQSCIWSERFDRASRLFGSVIDAIRRTGAPGWLSVALAARGELETWTGRWAAACADATEALQWADDTGHVWVAYALSTLARIDAARGNRRLCHERMERALREAAPRGIDCVHMHHASILGLSAMTHGDIDSAVDHLERAWTIARTVGLANPNVVPFAADLVEAHVRAGHVSRAQEVMRVLEAQATATALVHPTAAVARCRGLLAADIDSAETWFTHARHVHERLSMPFERARTLLCEGEVLRRGRRPAAARTPLREAATLFDGLGARPWADRAIVELCASGDRSTPIPEQQGALAALTPQEFQIARAVARGLNNVETAVELFMSRKTVEAHLTRIYRKLDLRSRNDLTRLLMAIGVDE